jgi:hypothetical protein
MISSVKHSAGWFGKSMAFAALSGFLALLSACESVPLTPVAETRPAPGALATGAGALWTRQLVAGSFKCDADDRVSVRMGDGQRNIVLTWDGATYTMLPVTTSTGALRFEDRTSGLVWIQIPAKSMLLNTRRGQQMANGCKV